MWNKFLGKKSSSDEDGGGEDVVMADATSVGGGAHPPDAIDTAAADHNPQQTTLRAVLLGQGTHVNVTVLLNNKEVSPPSSGVEDNEVEIEGIERSFSGSTKTSDQDTQDAITAKTPASTLEGVDTSTTNDSDDEELDLHPARRGRSASLGGEGDAADDNIGMGKDYSRENSSSSDGPNNNPTGAATEGETNFEASLLLGMSTATSSTANIASSTANNIALPATPQLEGKEKREPLDPTTLPTSMTSFLDMLTEEQRRVRHRHIPGVDGFRKLYKSEVKADMSAVRKMKRMDKLMKEVSSSVETSSAAEGDGDAMEVDDEHNVEGGEIADNISTISDVREEKEEKGLPDRGAFVIPTKDARKCATGGQLASLLDNTDFENVVKPNSSSSGGGMQRSPPTLVDSMTSFNPPRPQESTTYKTQSRLKRWEANPNEVEKDLLNYRKTVNRTREELHIAQREKERIESVASLMRTHFMEHLNGYRDELLVVNEGLVTVNGKCCKLDDVYRGRSMSTRGGNVGRGMKDVLGTLKMLGEEVKDVVPTTSSASAAGGKSDDWRVMGVGGVSLNRAARLDMASGWVLVGDDVVVCATGEEGTVVSVSGPEVVKKDDKGTKKTDEKAKETAKKDAGDSKPPASKSDVAMDVDSPDKKKSAEPSKKEEIKSADGAKKGPVVKSTTIEVKLQSGQVKSYSPSELQFNSKKLPTLLSLSDADLAKRWENMVSTALANGVGHDALAMEEYINASFKAEPPADAGVKEDGAASPKSVTQYADERALMPFGSGLIAAPADVKNYPSVIPLDNLEETVRKVVYDTDKPRVLPTMSANLRVHEARQEEMNALKGKVLQLRNRLGRQKRLRSLNERSLAAGKHRANKVEGLLLEMQMDLKNLKERLQDELDELGIGNGVAVSANETEMDTSEQKDEDKLVEADKGEVAEAKEKEAGADGAGGGEKRPLEEAKEGISAAEAATERSDVDKDNMEPESKRARTEE